MCCVRRVLGAVLSGLVMSQLAKTVPSEDIRLPLEFRRSLGAMNVVLAGSLRSQEPLLRLPVNLVRQADTNVLKVILPAMYVHKATEAYKDPQPA